MQKQISEEIAVGRLTEILALACGYAPSRARQLRFIAALHDIGKFRISPKLLNKPGKLTEEEFAVMQNHTLFGAEILSSVQGDFGKRARLIAAFHHYPN